MTAKPLKKEAFVVYTNILAAQLEDTTCATYYHLPENQSIHRIFFAILLYH
jgi:hypothetical protein